MKKGALVVLILSMAAIGLAYAAVFVSAGAATWSAWVMAIATPLAMVSTMTLGAARTGKANSGLGRLVIPFAVVLLIMLGAFTLAFILPASGEPLLLGIPRRAAIVMYGIGVIPVFILPLAYAVTFDELTLTEDDIERVREAARQAEAER